MGNSTFIFILQRDAGWCEASDKISGTRPGAAVRNPYFRIDTCQKTKRSMWRVGADGAPVVIRERYTMYGRCLFAVSMLH